MAPKYPSRITRELVQWAERYGWSFAGYARNGHLILEHTNGTVYQTAATPSEYRGTRNTKADLLRLAGAKEEKHRAGRPRKATSYRADTAEDEELLDDLDGQLSVTSSSAHPARLRDLRGRRKYVAGRLEAAGVDVPPAPDPLP